MPFLDRLTVEKLSYSTFSEEVQIDIDEINQGISQVKDFIFSRNRETIKVFDRVCDHNGGRLSLQGDIAVCPLHGWEFDVASGRYTNARCRKNPVAEILENELDAPYITLRNSKSRLDKTGYKSKKNVEVRFLNHACLHFNIGNEIRFATDPWVVGSAFSNGWWLAIDSPADVFDTLNSCDFIYISHNHPDHLHPGSLEHVRKDMPILTAAFESRSTATMLEQCGFKNVIAMDMSSRLIDHSREISLAVLKSGDFRDDSGLLVEAGEFSCLLTVDSNFLNFGKLPEVNLLCSSFAGGASGFPLCFENYAEPEKEIIVNRNKAAIRATNLKTIETVKPDYFLPYAGFFTEKAARDQYIKRLNKKNRIEDYESVCQKNNCQLLNVKQQDVFQFEGGVLIGSSKDSSFTYQDRSVETYLSKQTQLDEEQFAILVRDYFINSGFVDDLIVELCTTDDLFSEIHERFRIDFSFRDAVRVDRLAGNEDVEQFAADGGKRYLRIKVRREELIDVMANGKPWEDLSIGFQCRVYRQPNVYNSEFWFHFTNVYIAGRVPVTHPQHPAARP